MVIASRVPLIENKFNYLKILLIFRIIFILSTLSGKPAGEKVINQATLWELMRNKMTINLLISYI